MVWIEICQIKVIYPMDSLRFTRHFFFFSSYEAIHFYDYFNVFRIRQKKKTKNKTNIQKLLLSTQILL